jgi:hypothetical protein
MHVVRSVAQLADSEFSNAVNLGPKYSQHFWVAAFFALVQGFIQPSFMQGQAQGSAPSAPAAYKLCDRVSDRAFVELLHALNEKGPGAIVTSDILLRYQIILIQSPKDRSTTNEIKARAVQLNLKDCVHPLPVMVSTGRIEIATGILFVRFRDGFGAENAVKRLRDLNLEPIPTAGSRLGPRFEVADRDGDVFRLLQSAASLQESSDVIYAKPDMVQTINRPFFAEHGTKKSTN